MLSELFVILLAVLAAVSITLLLEFLRLALAARLLIIGAAALLAFVLILGFFLLPMPGEEGPPTGVDAGPAAVNHVAAGEEGRDRKQAIAQDQAETKPAAVSENRPAGPGQDQDEAGRANPPADADHRQTPEKNQPLAAPPAPGPSAAAPDREEEISAMLEGWRQAWEKAAGPHGEQAAFAAFHGAHFSAEGLDRSAWLAGKAAKNRKKSWIKVKLSDIRIGPPQPDGTVAVSFRQEYGSPDFSETGRKTLVLRHEDGGWKIVAVR